MHLFPGIHNAGLRWKRAPLREKIGKDMTVIRLEKQFESKKGQGVFRISYDTTAAAI